MQFLLETKPWTVQYKMKSNKFVSVKIFLTTAFLKYILLKKIIQINRQTVYLYKYFSKYIYPYSINLADQAQKPIKYAHSLAKSKRGPNLI